MLHCVYESVAYNTTCYINKLYINLFDNLYIFYW